MPNDLGQPKPKIRPSGGSRAYTISRLERNGRHDLAEAIRDGRVSAYAIATRMGWVRRPQNLHSGPTNAAKRREFQLSHLFPDASATRRRLQELQELWLGPNLDQGSLFNSREELKQSWQRHRTEAMRIWGSHGRRPRAFYEFEWQGDPPPYDNEQSCLWRAGTLGPEEKLEVEHRWRQDFDAVQGKDAHTQREHFQWADIPNELISEWKAEHRKSQKKKPQTTNSETEDATAAKGATTTHS
jgi:hypothetical protein